MRVPFGDWLPLFHCCSLYSAKFKNIEETEKAKQLLIEDKMKK